MGDFLPRKAKVSALGCKAWNCPFSLGAASERWWWILLFLKHSCMGDMFLGPTLGDHMACASHHPWQPATVATTNHMLLQETDVWEQVQISMGDQLPKLIQVIYIYIYISGIGGKSQYLIDLDPHPNRACEGFWYISSSAGFAIDSYLQVCGTISKTNH